MRAIGDTVGAWKAPILRYERHLSALAMVVGFGVDNFTFGRVDHPGAHIVFCAYLAVAVVSIAIAHALQGREDRNAAQERARLVPGAASPEQQPRPRSRFRLWLAAATQFALGGLWSGFLVFYSRSAVLSTSWPFLLLLLGFLVGNEIFRKYHSRLVFASLLLFFALYSYAVFVVPVFTKTMGVATFLGSGALAGAAYYLFLRLLGELDRARYRQSRWKLVGGALAIAAAMNVFYFTGVLPPLPLALSDVGVYHAIRHNGAVYQAQYESQPWMVRLGLGRPIVHVAPGEKLALYSAVFAPIKMTTRITHRWQKWDGRAKAWRVAGVVSFSISGGRDRGYRGYSVKSAPAPGDWRVDIDAADGRRIGRLAFTIVGTSSPIATTTKILP